jgi:hypothetical protein
MEGVRDRSGRAPGVKSGRTDLEVASAESTCGLTFRRFPRADSSIVPPGLSFETLIGPCGATEVGVEGLGVVG